MDTIFLYKQAIIDRAIAEPKFKDALRLESHRFRLNDDNDMSDALMDMYYLAQKAIANASPSPFVQYLEQMGIVADDLLGALRKPHIPNAETIAAMPECEKTDLRSLWEDCHG